MSDMSRSEKARAAAEARDAVATRPAGSSAAAVAAAMRRYLSAEQYHDLQEEKEETERSSMPEPHVRGES